MMKPQQPRINQLKDLLYHSQSRDEANLDDLIKLVPSLPNQVAYIFDCNTLEIDIISGNIYKLFGRSGFEFNSLEDYYEVVIDLHQKSFIKLNINVFDAIRNGCIPFDTIKGNVSSAIYKTRTNRTMLKQSFALKVVANKVRYSAGILTDLTGIYPENRFSYQYSGPSDKILYSNLNGISEFNDVLSKRELEIIQMIGEGFKSKQIASQLFISKETVDKHRKNILKKLTVSNSIQAYRKAIEMGLLRGL